MFISVLELQTSGTSQLLLFTFLIFLPLYPETLEQRGLAGCVVLVCQESDQQVGSQSGPRLFEGVLHVCLERLSQLELWLQKSQRSLQAAGVAGVATMQDSVEQQLLTCQVSSAHQGDQPPPRIYKRQMLPQLSLC